MKPEAPRNTNETDDEFNEWNRIHHDNENERETKQQIGKNALNYLKHEEQSDWRKAIKTPEGEARYQENLHSMDERTERYVWRLVSNLDHLLGEFIAKGEDRELVYTVTDKLNENIYNGGLNGAYLNKEGSFYTGNLADEYRGYDEEDDDDKKAIEDLDTTKPEGTQTGNTYEDNMSTMDERTKAYIWHLGNNLPKLLGEEGLRSKGDISIKFIDRMNQAIEDGKLNGSYLGNDSILHIRYTADEYRGYDKKKPSKIETPTTKKPEVETKQPATKPGEKTPEELGFRDW